MQRKRSLKHVLGHFLSAETRRGFPKLFKCSVLMMATFAMGLPAGFGAPSFYMAPDGDDANSGSQDAPFATFERAQRAVRETKQAETSLPVTVFLRGGAYRISEPVLFGPEDGGAPGAPVLYAAYGDEAPVISGGIEVDSQWRPYQNGILVADATTSVLEIDQLFIDGEQMHMARYPNYDPKAQFFGGASGDAIAPERVKSWAKPAGGYLHALHESMWGSKHYRIVGANAAGELSLQGGWQENRGGGFDKFYRGGYHKDILVVENIFEELDAPGEWYLDRDAGKIYVYPPSGVDLNKARIIGAQALELFTIRGSADAPVRFLDFEGLSFKHTRRVFMEPYERLLRGDWSIARLAAVRFEGTSDCTVRDCFFEDLGGNGVFLSGYNRRVHVMGSRFTRLGESAVCLVGNLDAVRSPAVEYSVTLPQDEIDPTPGPKSPDYPAYCRVHDNLMHRFGLVGKQVSGVVVSMAECITVSHNTIYDIPRAAICINDGCWGGHVVEYNDVFNTVRETGDHGPFNSWGRDRFWKTATHSGRDLEPRQRARSVLDNWKTTHIRNNRFAHPGGHSWGIDLDDGTSNYYLYNNLCLGMGIKFREGFFRRAENNIVVNGFGGFHIWLPGGDDAVARNIFVSDKPYQFISADPATAAEIDFNLFYWPDARVRMVSGDFDLTLDAWQARGFDRHSIEADPLFIDPAHGDYRVRPDSPALALGFNNFPMDQFGVLKPAFRDEVAREPRNDPFTIAQSAGKKTRSAKPVEWLGATIKNLTGEAEKSAVGIGEETGVLFVAVPPASEAARIGFKPNDLLLAMEGKKIHALADLARLLKEHEEQTVTCTVLGEVQREIKMKVLLTYALPESTM